MSRRYVKNSRVDSLGKIIPEVVAVVSAKNQIEVVDDSQKYFKRNYLEAVRKIVPKFYFTDEQAISGTQVSFPNQLINSHILAVKNQPLLFPLSIMLLIRYSPKFPLSIRGFPRLAQLSRIYPYLQSVPSLVIHLEPISI